MDCTPSGAAASVKAFRKLENDTMGQWLTTAGYYTAFLGKYINGMECNAVSGFRHWGGLTCESINEGGKTHLMGGTYNYYNASQWSATYDVTGKKLVGERTYKAWTGVHQSEFLANQTLDHVRIAISNDEPFFIHTTPLMVSLGSVTSGDGHPSFRLHLPTPSRPSQRHSHMGCLRPIRFTGARAMAPKRKMLLPRTIPILRRSCLIPAPTAMVRSRAFVT